MGNKPTKVDNDFHDKEEVAWHEAGHATVAAVICRTKQNGGIVTTLIYPNNGEVTERGRSWLGQVRYTITGLSASDKAVISVAGVVAEVLLDDDQIDSYDIITHWKYKEIEPSPADLRTIPRTWKARTAAVERALGLLREHRALLEAVVARLLRKGVVPNTVLQKFVKRFGNPSHQANGKRQKKRSLTK